MTTNVDWATMVVEDTQSLFGAPVKATTNEIDNVLRWMVAENPASNWAPRNNPLNNGYGSGGGAGLGGYPDLATAAQDVAGNLHNSSPSFGYGAIAADLIGNASATQFSSDVVHSSWAESRYGVAAAGAPPQYTVAGRGTDYIASLSIPGVVPAAASSSGSSSSSSSAGGGAALTGLNANPLDGFGIPGTLWGAVSSAGGGPVASGILGVVGTITKPLTSFLTNAFLVVAGLVVVIVGLVLLAHAAGHDPSTPDVITRGGGSSSSRGEGEGAGAGAGSDVVEAAAA